MSLTKESNALLTNCKELNFFVTTVKNLTIPNYENSDPQAKDINDPTLKAIVKWRKHPSILAIASEYENEANVYFNFFFKEDAQDVCFLKN